MIDITERVRSNAHTDIYMTAEEAAQLIHPDDIVGVSSFTPCGYPKAVPLALAKRIEKEQFKVQIWAGGSLGDEIDGALSRVHGISRRYLFQSNPELRRQINHGEVAFSDVHVSTFPQSIRENFFGQPDIVLVEAIAITEDGALIPATSIGLTPALIDSCDRIVVEVNVTQPLCLEGMHDVYGLPNPPHRKPIPICHPGDRIGTTTIPCGWDKIIAIVPSAIPDTPFPLKPVDTAAKQMGKLLVDFFRREVKNGRLPQNLLPLQSGVGSVSNAIIGCLAHSEFEHLSIYTEVFQDGMLDLIDAGKTDIVSTGSISTSPQGLKRFYDNIDFYNKHIIIRPMEITNNPEVARRLGSIAMNTAIECDIYGNVNSTHICGTKLMNGLGGAGDFARSAYLTIFCTPSIAKNGDISAIVPMCSHVDHPEHDVDIICTEQGIADLRGLCPIERARTIIENCAHPDYKDMLTDYLDRAIEETGCAHTPHILTEALSWHQRFLDTGTMKK
ncbi:MAG: succinate CoA transferase [Megasphaera sp.]|jgi:succinyl-CoA:acetate CoA-transferase|nr:succinate CoA transferase [Megasphaera sp.]MCH4218449.1 succinate CoA transferase [Megasphaera sp.]